jgi:hypothetical protein
MNLLHVPKLYAWQTYFLKAFLSFPMSEILNAWESNAVWYDNYYKITDE